MQEITKKLYNQYFVSNKNIYLITNQDFLKNYRKIEYIGKVFIVYFHKNKKQNSLFITQKGLFSYYKGSRFNIAWSEFKKLSIGYSGNMIFLGSLVLYVNKPKEFYSFFKELQKMLNKTSIQTDEEAFKILKESQKQMDIIEEKLDFYISVVASLNHVKKFIP